jgi:hypothetical protein
MPGVKLTHWILIALGLYIALRLARPLVEHVRAERVVRKPDKPIAFSGGLPWLAVKAGSVRSIAAALGLQEPKAVNWRHGLAEIEAADESRPSVFVSPPVLGWTLVVGLPLPGPVGRRFADKCTPLLQDLSRRFKEVQYFQGDGTVDLYAWARAIDGRVTRAFAIGDEGIIWNKGRLTKEERSLGLKMFELRGVETGAAAAAVGDLFAYPTEEHVLKLASHWSLDPSALDKAEARAGAGLIGRAPASWRPSRAARP